MSRYIRLSEHRLSIHNGDFNSHKDKSDEKKGNTNPVNDLRFNLKLILEKWI